MSAFAAPPAIWERLARAGKRTLAIDPYESRPPRDWRGTYVCGWQFADRVVLPRWSLPRAAAGKLARRHGRGPHATEIFGRPTVRDLLALREKLLAAPARVADAAVDLLARERYDLVWLTFSAAHLAGHQFWDLSQLAEMPEGRDRELLEGALADIYEAVDTAFARALAALPGDADVIVTSAVGMDVNSSRADLLPGMLAAVLSGEPLPAGGGGAGAIWRLRGAVPPRARGAIASALPDRVALELTARLELRGVDWSQTKAFAHPADNQGYVRLNLRGRERDGIVDAAQVDELLAQISDGLQTFCDPDGEAAVAGIERVAEHHPRRALGPAPRPRRALERAPGDDPRRRLLADVRRRHAQRRRQRPLRQPHPRRRLGGRRRRRLRLPHPRRTSTAWPTSPRRSPPSAASTPPASKATPCCNRPGNRPIPVRGHYATPTWDRSRPALSCPRPRTAPHGPDDLCGIGRGPRAARHGLAQRPTAPATYVGSVAAGAQRATASRSAPTAPATCASTTSAAMRGPPRRAARASRP